MTRVGELAAADQLAAKVASPALTRACRDLLAAHPPQLGPEYRYRGLALAVADAVYSIGVRYATTQATVARIATALGLPDPHVPATVSWPSVPEEASIGRALGAFEGMSPERLAQDVWRNRQRTSTRDGAPRKAAAVLAVWEVLRTHRIDTLTDFQRLLAGDPAQLDQVRAAVCGVPGQGSGIMWDYLQMLAGNSDQLKADRMVCRFVERHTGLALSPSDAARQVRLAHGALGAACTLRELDYVIWSTERLLAPPTPADRARVKRPVRSPRTSA